MDLGKKLREARGATNLTQQHMADRMGISKSTYCGYETGKRQPDVYKLKEISEILNVSADELLEIRIIADHFEALRKAEPAAQSGEPSEQDEELANLLRQLNYEQVVRVMDFVRGLLASR